MPSTLDSELVDTYEREVQKLVETESKYQSDIGMPEISVIVQMFRFALEHGVDKVSVQMLYDMVDSGSGD